MPARLAIDIGAESGRVMLGHDGSDDLVEVHRFANGPLVVDGTLRWDVRRLFAETMRGIALAIERHGDIASVGVDTWGVDYALVDDRGELVEPPWHHRDTRTAAAPDLVHGLIPEGELFRRTGVRAMPFNTIYQLAVHRRSDPAVFDRAARFLTIPDLLLSWLSGVHVCEHTNAGTTGLLRAGTREWDDGILAAIGVPRRLFPEVVAPGTVLGPLRDDLGVDLGTRARPLVIAPACHDTAAAAACVADAGDDGGYLSSGTWSLMGVTLDAPALDEDVRAAGLGNEVAADGRPRLNRNIMGLWIVQECRRAFAAAGREWDYAGLTALAAVASPSHLTLDVDDPRFFSPQGEPMPARIAAWYRERGRPAPADDGQTVRWVLEGLAAAYARCADELERVTRRPLRRITVVGGGSRNRLLIDLTAAASGRAVVAGPAEATALGNLRIQATAAARPGLGSGVRGLGSAPS